MNEQMVSGQGEERRKTSRKREREGEMSRQGRRTANDSAQESVTESDLELGRGRYTEIVRGGDGAREILNVRDTDTVGLRESG